MWNNYFFNIQKKYSMRLSTKEPLVVRLDGKDVTKNKKINLICRDANSFSEILEKTAGYFTQRYHCYAIFGSDEISFIFPQPYLLIEDLGTDKSNYSNEVISVFSQYFFEYFYHLNQPNIIFWHAKCFSIPKEKIVSYVKYRSGIIENVLITYFLKKHNQPMEGKKLEEKIEKCKKLSNYGELEPIQKGTMYYNGKKIILADFLEGKITNAEQIEDMFSDLLGE